MRERIRTWLDHTHGAGFELVRHFLGRTFDNEFSAPGEWQKPAAGILAAILSVGILAVYTYNQRFNRMREAAIEASRILNEMRADEIMFIAAAMGITAILTAFVWQSLFPTRRDCLALAGLPLSGGQIFRAKSFALLIVFGVFVLALNLPWAAMYAMTASNSVPGVSSFNLIPATFAGMAGVSIFVFFSLLALQGILLLVLSGRAFERVSLILQGAVFVTALGLLPLIGRQPVAAWWWPPVWFVDLWESMVRGPGRVRPAAIAVVLPVAVSVLAYVVSYQRFRRILLEAPLERSSDRQTGIGSWLLDRWIRDPRQQAAFAFIWKTLTRSRSHRLVLLAYAGIALGAITKSALDMPRPSLQNQGMYGLVVVLAPLAVAMLLTVGLRYLFTLPEAHTANWIFRSNDRAGRAAWLAAVERFVIACGIAPLFLISFPAAVVIFGWARALAAIVLSFFTALLWFETLFRRWQKLPFTCSYLPGEKPVWLTIARYGFAAPFLGPLGFLILYSSGEPTALVATLSLQVAAWWKLRTTRKLFWATCPLRYEEVPEAAVMTLELRQPTEETESSVAVAHQTERPLFKGVGSRGLVPEDWVEEFRRERTAPAAMIESVLEDVRYSFRMIRRSPLFSAIVILILTVGIGINASVFTIVSSVALKSHVGNPASFVRINPATRLQNKQRQVSFSEYGAWRDQTRSLRHLAAFSYLGVLIGEDDAEGSEALAVSCNFFQVDGLDVPIAGRLFVREDCLSANAIPVAVISESIWRNRFASDPGLIGRTVEMNNMPVILVGVVPDRTSRWARFRNQPFGAWLPYTAMTYFEPESRLFTQTETLWLSLAGRLAPGYSRSQAQTEFNVLAERTDRLNAGRRTSVVVTDGSWAAQFELSASGKDLMLLAFFFGTFNLVLFIACANVATLLLSRAAGRQREIALRLSLGAPRIRLVRLLVTESLILSAVAGIISIYLAGRVPEPLFGLISNRAHDMTLTPDWRTFSYIAAVVLLTGILAGLAPALESLKVDLTASLKGAGGAFLGPLSGARLRGFLVSAQIALSMVLLVEAALFARSEERALNADPGYTPRKVVVAAFGFPNEVSQQSVQSRMLAIGLRTASIPGVRSIAFSERVPLMRPDTVDLRPPLRQDATQPVDIYTASPRFFETLGIPLVRGREFQESDGPSVIVSQSLARMFWPRRDPIGQTLALPTGALTVVGVARDVESNRLGGSDNPAAYRQTKPGSRFSVMSVHFDTGAATGPQAVRNAIRQVDRHIPVAPLLMQAWIDRVTAELWNVVALMMVLGLVGTVLSTTGIYGAVSFAVNQRTKELGIRLALGATRWDIARHIFRFGGKPVLQGLIVGLWMAVAAAAGLREGFSRSIVRIDSREPLLYGAAMLLLGAAAVLAMIGPARRGANADPQDALRCE